MYNPQISFSQILLGFISSITPGSITCPVIMISTFVLDFRIILCVCVCIQCLLPILSSDVSWLAEVYPLVVSSRSVHVNNIPWVLFVIFYTWRMAWLDMKYLVPTLILYLTNIALLISGIECCGKIWGQSGINPL